MKKIILLISCLPMSLSLFAQDAVEASECEVAVGRSISFLDVVLGSGYIGIGIWILIFSFILIGFILGIFAIIGSATTKSKQIPIAVKLLPVGFCFLFLLGFWGAIIGAVDSCLCIGRYTGEVKGMLALYLSQSLCSLSFSLFGSLEYVVFFAIALILLHFKQKKMIENTQ